MSAQVCGPAVLALRSAVTDSLADLPAGSRVVVACSGGPDSLALAATLAWVAARQELVAHAVIVDHQLQDGSNAVADTAKRLCMGFGLSADVFTVQVGTEGGPEMAARTARYGALKSASRDLAAVAVLLGHTRDDQAESVLLGLAQGSGARSIAGMRAVSGLWRRPLLHLDRDTVHEAGAEIFGSAAWHDPHNADERFARVRVRAAMETLEDSIGPGIAAALARTADLLRDDADALDDLANQVVLKSDNSIDVAVLEELSAAIRTRVLRRMAFDAGCDPRALSYEHVRSVERLITHWHGQGAAHLPSGVSADRAHGRIRFYAPR